VNILAEKMVILNESKRREISFDFRKKMQMDAMDEIESITIRTNRGRKYTNQKTMSSGKFLLN